MEAESVPLFLHEHRIRPLLPLLWNARSTLAILYIRLVSEPSVGIGPLERHLGDGHIGGVSEKGRSRQERYITNPVVPFNNYTPRKYPSDSRKNNTYTSHHHF